MGRVSKRALLLLTQFTRPLAAAIAITWFAGAAASAETHPFVLTVYTHGDSRFAQLQRDGSVTGSAPTVLSCAMPQLGIPYEIKVLPLSRARSIIETYENAMWFPSSHTGDQPRRQRLVGPIDEVTILWYQLKTHPDDPNSEDFRRDAIVTAYTGSALENELRDMGFTIVAGSADHNRLIYMIMSGEVDALLAIDFRDVLPDDMRRLVEERMRVTERRKIPVSFQASTSLAAARPAFIKDMRAAVRTCQQ